MLFPIFELVEKAWLSYCNFITFIVFWHPFIRQMNNEIYKLLPLFCKKQWDFIGAYKYISINSSKWARVDYIAGQFRATILLGGLTYLTILATNYAIANHLGIFG